MRNVADENIVLVQGANPGDMTTVIALNETSLFLWNSLYGKDFEQDDIVSLLTSHSDVDEETARKDAAEWVATLQKNKVLA